MKIFQLFACLSKAEVKLLRKAVHSPLYNTNQKVVQLFDCLRPHHPNFDDSVKARKKLFKKLFPKETYNDYKLRWHFTELTKVIEQLLLYIAQESHSFERQRRLTKVYQQRGLHSLFLKGSKNLLATLAQEKTAFSNAAFHLNKLETLLTLYHHPLHNRYDANENLLEQAAISLDTYFTIHKLRITSALKSKEKIQKKTYAHRFLPSIKAAITKGFTSKDNLFKLYLQAIQLIEEAELIDFEAYSTLLFNHISLLDKQDQKFLFTIGLNHLTRQYNREAESAEKVFNWYQKGLQLELLIEQGILEEGIFGNIVIFSSTTKAFAWAKNFIDNYQSYLAEEIRAEVTAYYEGIWYYYQHKLEEALERLSQFESISPYAYRTKIVIIRILFEKFLSDPSYTSILLSAIQSFQLLAKRNTYFRKGKFTPHLNFIKIIQQFLKKKSEQEKPKSIKNWLLKQCNSKTPIYARKWLVQLAKTL